MSLYRPLVNVIDVLGSSDGTVNNVSLERLKGMCIQIHTYMHTHIPHYTKTSPFAHYHQTQVNVN